MKRRKTVLLILVCIFLAYPGYISFQIGVYWHWLKKYTTTLNGPDPKPSLFKQQNYLLELGILEKVYYEYKNVRAHGIALKNTIGLLTKISQEVGFLNSYFNFKKNGIEIVCLKWNKEQTKLFLHNFFEKTQYPELETYDIIAGIAMNDSIFEEKYLITKEKLKLISSVANEDKQISPLEARMIRFVTSEKHAKIETSAEEFLEKILKNLPPEEKLNSIE